LVIWNRHSDGNGLAAGKITLIKKQKDELNGSSFSFLGGDEEDRTPGLGIANAALSQLSYIPREVIIKTSSISVNYQVSTLTQ
jgi:hypothetical protein